MGIGLSLFVIAIGTLVVWSARSRHAVRPQDSVATTAGDVKALAPQVLLWIVPSGTELGVEWEELTDCRQAA